MQDGYALRIKEPAKRIQHPHRIGRRGVDSHRDKVPDRIPRYDLHLVAIVDEGRRTLICCSFGTVGIKHDRKTVAAGRSV